MVSRALQTAFARQTKTLPAAACVIGLCMGVLTYAWALITWAPEGDSALHLKLIADIAHEGRLPLNLPIVASVGPGGSDTHMFPYSYTPLFHLVGAAMYAVAGERGLPLLAACASGLISVCFFTVIRRRFPTPVAALSAVSWFVPYTTVLVFTRLYSEPLMLAAFLWAAWFAYQSLVRRSAGYSVAAGACLAVAISTKQIGFIYGTTLAAVVGLYALERRRWLRRSDLNLVRVFAATCALVAAPSIAYLVVATGTLGYADLHVPGFGGRIPIDADANAYMAAITKPQGNIIDWLDRYRAAVFFAERWSPKWMTVVPLALFAIGAIAMERAGGAPRFFARLAVAQFVAEALLYVTVHGNDRYVIASRTLIYAVMPVGVYACANLIFGLRVNLRTWRAVRPVVSFAPLAVFLLTSLLAPDYWSALQRSADGAQSRAQQYESMGSWVRTNTEPSALILAPRTYTATLTFHRDVTWISFYGNAWVVDALYTPSSVDANRILHDRGIDYVLVSSPSGVYIDRVPWYGMGSYLGAGRPAAAGFELVHRVSDQETTSSLSLYRVVEIDDRSACIHSNGRGGSC